MYEYSFINKAETDASIQVTALQSFQHGHSLKRKQTWTRNRLAICKELIWQMYWRPSFCILKFDVLFPKTFIKLFIPSEQFIKDSPTPHVANYSTHRLHPLTITSPRLPSASPRFHILLPNVHPPSAPNYLRYIKSILFLHHLELRSMADFFPLPQMLH